MLSLPQPLSPLMTLWAPWSDLGPPGRPSTRPHEALVGRGVDAECVYISIYLYIYILYIYIYICVYIYIHIWAIPPKLAPVSENTVFAIFGYIIKLFALQ